jgi:SAM-dependent methyltransferase
LDVIEHIDNDVHALTECKRILRQGGILIITVPAFMVLWSPWDEALCHKRRYTIPGLISAVNKSGLRVVKLSYFFLLILPAVVAVRQLKCFFKRESTNYTTDFITVPRWLNKVLITAGRLERWFIVKLGTALPFGLSIISVLQKPKFGSNPRCS